MTSTHIDWDSLIQAARKAREHAYAPYSGYQVGAALLGDDGRVYAAGNVENGIPALAICAERNAVARAVNAGVTTFRALTVVTASTPPASPCGLCRQALAEFVDDLPILRTNLQGERTETSLAELFPQPFVLGREVVVE